VGWLALQSLRQSHDGGPRSGDLNDAEILTPHGKRWTDAAVASEKALREQRATGLKRQHCSITQPRVGFVLTGISVSELTSQCGHSLPSRQPRFATLDATLPSGHFHDGHGMRRTSTTSV
jgi:hypothetical protein